MIGHFFSFRRTRWESSGLTHFAVGSVLGRQVNHILDQVLYLCVSTWEGDPISFTANMLKGVAKFINTFGDTIRNDVFVERLGRVSAKEITRTAKERRNGSLGFAEAILMYYNKKTKYPLQWGKLYNAKIDNGCETSDEDNLTGNSAGDYDTDDEAEYSNVPSLYLGS